MQDSRYDFSGGLRSVVAHSHSVSNYQNWNTNFWLFVAILTIVVFAFVKTKSTNRNLDPQRSSGGIAAAAGLAVASNLDTESNSTVLLNPIAIQYETNIQSVSSEVEDAEVRPKQMQSFRPSAASAQNELHGFREFQQAFETERQYSVPDTKFGHHSILEQMQNTSEFQRFAETNNLPLNIAEKMNEGIKERIDFRSSDQAGAYGGANDPETLVIIRDALQSIPTSLNKQSEAAIVLKDILDARFQLYKMGTKLECPQEQLDSIRIWATRSGICAELAKTILSRK